MGTGTFSVGIPVTGAAMERTKDTLTEPEVECTFCVKRRVRIDTHTPRTNNSTLRYITTVTQTPVHGEHIQNSAN